MALVLLLPLLVAAGCGTEPATGDREPPGHILLITLDALRADHLGCYGYPRPTSPAIDRLAMDGTLFNNVQVPRGQTWPALSSLLTGQYPIQHGIRTNSTLPGAQLELLPQFMRDAGYRTAAFLSNYGDAVRSKEAFGLDHLSRADVSGPTPHDQLDDRMTDQAISWITEQRHRSSFTWVHLMNPHRPYDPPAVERELLVGDQYQGWLAGGITMTGLRQGMRDGSIALTEAGLDEFVHARYWKPWIADSYLELLQQQDWALTFDQLLDLLVMQQVELLPGDLAYIHSRYDAEVRAADRCVGRLLETIDRLGLTDRTLVIFSSDHGDELYDHNHYLFHSASIHQGVLHVPLILRWPGQVRPSVVDRGLVEITDLLPTILEATGQPTPPGLPGRDLLSRTEKPRSTLAFAEVTHRLPKGQEVEPPMDAAYSVRDARWKLVLNPSGLHPRHVPYTCLPDRGYPIAREALYDLDEDPGEQNNLLALGRQNLKEVALDIGDGEHLDAAEYLLEANLAFIRLSSELTAWLERNKGTAAPAQTGQVTEEVRQRLASLGYVEAKPLRPSPAAAAARNHGQEDLIQTALQLTRRTEAASERARHLARRAQDRLDELDSVHPIAE